MNEDKTMTAALEYSVLFLACFLIAGLSCSDDLPCSPMTTEYGYICVCNSSYCDTITFPSALNSGHYYHYVTSSTSPGFTRSKGKFSDTSQLKPDFSVKNKSSTDSEVTIYLDSSITYQTFKGMGAALTDTAGSLILNMDNGTIDNLMESFFGSKGLEYPYIRIAAASSDYSPSYYTQDDVNGDVEMRYWNLTAEDLNIKIPLIKKANATSSRGIKVFASPWSAPDWMKTSQSSYQGYLYTQYHEAWAKYFVKFLQAYQNESVPIWAMTLGNEVILSLYFGTQFTMGNMIMLPTQQRYWVNNYLGPMLEEAGFSNVLLYALDDERPFLNWTAERLFTDDEYSKYVSGVSIHWYFDWNTTTWMLDSFHERFPEKSIIYTEASINNAQADYPDDVTALGHWGDARRYILDMYEALCHWAEMYLDWNLVLDTDGGPVGLDDFNLDASIIVNTTSGELYKQPIFYAMGHFSKFIQPGAQRINVQVQQVSNDTYDEECSAASQDLAKRMAQAKLKSEKAKAETKEKIEESEDRPSVKALPTNTPYVPSTAVRVLAVVNPDGSQSVIVYNPRDETAKLTITDSVKGTFTKKIDPYSLNTFLYW